MKSLLIASVFSLCTIAMGAAEAYQYNEYYFQRKSLFENLPVNNNDIVFVGNSLTNGGDWHEIFNSPTVKNRGIASDVIQGMSDRIDLVLKGKPKKLFLLGGVNDISHKIGADSVAKAIEKLVIKIRKESPETKLYLQSLLPINNDFGRYRNLKGTESIFPAANLLLEKVATRNGATWVNLVPAFADASGKMRKELTSDGLHLNSEGYKIWRDAVAQYVEIPINENLYSIDQNDVVMVGNSLVGGCEWFELLNMPNVKKRVTGDVITSLPQTVKSIAAAKPQKMFILSSYNDMSGKLNADSIVKIIERSILNIKSVSPATKIYLQGIIPVNSKYASYTTFAGQGEEIVRINERLRNIAKKNGIKWINLYPIFADDNGDLRQEYTNDGFHLMGNAYVAWRDAIIKYFK